MNADEIAHLRYEYERIGKILWEIKINRERSKTPETGSPLGSPSRFDRRVEILRGTMGVPDHLVDAAVYVNDTMEIARIIADDVFQDDATIEAALAIYDRIDRERLRLAVKGRVAPAGAGG
jgi:hypothetical protein